MSALDGLAPRRVVRDARCVFSVSRRLLDSSFVGDLSREEVVSHWLISASSVEL